MTDAISQGYPLIIEGPDGSKAFVVGWAKNADDPVRWDPITMASHDKDDYAAVWDDHSWEGSRLRLPGSDS